MPMPASLEIAPENLSAHPATRMWSRTGFAPTQPTAVETLRLRSKSAVYRLHGIGPNHTAVIAKRCPLETGRIERLIYEQILPALPLPALRFFGLVDDPDDGLGWLFIEDAGDEPFLFSSPEHRLAVARWLAILHTSAARLNTVAPLPDRSQEYYRGHLRQAVKNIAANLANPALTPDGQAVFRQILAQCDRLDAVWDRVEQFAAGIPVTFFHGDLKENNIRVRRTRQGLELLPFDWEIAGWGIPATDLMKCPDLRLYWSEARAAWPQSNFDDLQQAAQLGRVFRALIAIYWESLDLSHDWVAWPLEKLRFYSIRLAEGAQNLGIT